jgi:DNA-binding MarR family transcriptional regulator
MLTFHPVLIVYAFDSATMPLSKTYPTENSIILLMRTALLGLLRNTVAKIASKHGISTNAWYFLRILWEKDGLTQKELAIRAGVLQPNAVSTIRSMTQAGLVRVEREVEDRRSMRVWLTPKARELEGQLLSKYHKQANQIFSGCLSDEEKQTLTRLLRKLSVYVSKM